MADHPTAGFTASDPPPESRSTLAVGRLLWTRTDIAQQECKLLSTHPQHILQLCLCRSIEEVQHPNLLVALKIGVLFSSAFEIALNVAVKMVGLPAQFLRNNRRNCCFACTR